jgi:hypothetical protein
MRDFNLKVYRNLLETFISQDYLFITFSNYVEKSETVDISSKIILRHDVEQKYENALQFAIIQNQLGIIGTYFFRILPKHFKKDIVKQIADLGHEIAYHYDDLSECNGDYEKAIARFEKNLKILRNIAPVQTICMDGSPRSKYDNKDLWRRGDGETEREGEREKGRRGATEMIPQSLSPLVPQSHYRDFGIIGEPYFDIDFDEMFYLTDTGRRWDGWKVSVRDKVPQQDDWIKKGLVFHSTNDIVKAANEKRLPDEIMITFHPQRWHDSSLPWIKELILQNAKNVVKRFIVKT